MKSAETKERRFSFVGGAVRLIALVGLFLATLAQFFPRTRNLNDFLLYGVDETEEEGPAAICAIVKDDEAYIDEWVDYHHALGFSHFYVYDNSKEHFMKQWGEEKGDHVTLLHFPDSIKQMFDDCARRCAYDNRYQWVAFFEVNEFLFLRNGYNLMTLLRKFSQRGAISVTIGLFGSSGRRVYSPQPVTKRFLYREEFMDDQVKSIIKVSDLTLHLPRLRRKSRNSMGLRELPSSNPHLSSDIAVLHHYLRSKKEYKSKVGKFLYLDETKNRDDFHEYELVNGTIFDDSGWKTLTSLLPKYKLYDANQTTWPSPRFPSTRTNETAAVCVLVKYEEAYIDEWIDYHYALGFSHFYIYDNSHEFEMEQWASEKGPHVTMTHYVGNGIQREAYQHCLTNHVIKDRHSWVAFFDADEMIILKKHNNIVDLLFEHCERGVLSINWVVFGPGKREVYQPLPFTKRFQYRPEDVSVHLKSIGRVQDLSLRKPPHAHYPYLKRRRGDVVQHDAENHSIKPQEYYNSYRPSNVTVVHHYNSKSYKEYIAKRMRGRGAETTQVDDLIRAARDRVVNDCPLYSNEGWEATKKFLPYYESFDAMLAS